MTDSSFHSDKIINPLFAQIFTHGTEPYGSFKAFVRFAEPAKKPAYIKVMELHSPGLFKVRIPCDQIVNAADDDNILSIELREHTT